MTGHGENGHTHQHHGGAGGFVFDVLDAIMLGCFVIVCGLLAEIAWKQYRGRDDRYNLTPEGRAAVTDPLPEPHPHSGVRVDTDVLGES